MQEKEQIEEQDDAELDGVRQNLWKQFGIETAAGKELFNLYRSHKKPQINYPKTRPRKESVQKEKIIKPCPQKTQIEYPSLQKPQSAKFHMIDLVPHRKREEEIRAEIEKYYEGRKFYRPRIAGADRRRLIEDLQMKFKYLRGALPKGAELPAIDMKQANLINLEEQKSQAIKRTLKKDIYYTGLKSTQNDSETVISDDPVIELNILFDQIVKEIDERQQFLNEIEHLQEPKLKQRIKDEIIERVAELKKVSQIKKTYK